MNVTSCYMEKLASSLKSIDSEGKTLRAISQTTVFIGKSQTFIA